MFIDSLDSGGLVGAGSTLDKNRTLSEEAALKQYQLYNNQTLSNTNNNNKTLINTQGRRDLADLEVVYQHLAGYADGNSGNTLNTLARTIENIQAKDLSINQSKDSSTDHSGGIGMQTIHAIRSELENRELQNILKAIEMQNNKYNKLSKNYNTNKTGERLHKRESRANAKYNHDEELADDDMGSGAWPPKKYEHIKGTGYGSSWRPVTSKRSIPNENDVKRGGGSASNRSTSRSKSETRLINRNFGSNPNLNYSKNENDIFSSRGSLHGGPNEKYYAQLSDLKSNNLKF